MRAVARATSTVCWMLSVLPLLSVTVSVTVYEPGPE